MLNVNKIKKIKLPRNLDRRIRLTEEDKEEIISLGNSGYSQTKIGLMFGVHRTTIGYILNNLIYENKKDLQKHYNYDYGTEYRVNQVNKNTEYKKSLHKEGII